MKEEEKEEECNNNNNNNNNLPSSNTPDLGLFMEYTHTRLGGDTHTQMRYRLVLTLSDALAEMWTSSHINTSRERILRFFPSVQAILESNF